MQQTLNPPQTWPVINRILFRFFSIYLLLYHFAGYIPQVWWDNAVTRAGQLLLRKDYSIQAWPMGSGDTTFNYLQLFCLLLIALTGCLLWSVIDRKRKNYDKAQYWVMVPLCYTLAMATLKYGMAKVFPGQFEELSLYKLEQPLGESSPMGLAWTFMGYSRGYTIFSGIAECLGGFLLLFRRTRLLGALVCIAVMTNVVALNFFYDICVKLYSGHLLLTALFLIMPDMKRMVRFFILQQPVSITTQYYPVFTTRWKRYVFNSLRYAAVVWVLWYTVKIGIYVDRSYQKRHIKGAIFGTYEVFSFSPLLKDQLATSTHTFPPLKKVRPAWKTLYFEKGGILLYQEAENMKGAAVNADTVTHILNWKAQDDTESVHMHYTFNGDTLTLKGTIGNDSVLVSLRRKDRDHSLLTNRGFHWVNETPFNK
ncbi:hypothetical protein HHL17_15250 [Chitinophaga sp. G-6-1-13]|uniref:DoxX family protein n=1 Tax=Chitinophaga fulva TaxID=2728842 RepID=A0A848GJI9_9BACT|nr:hypothetical protein [Chitinophaga fulva]NML38564.1 hypothetical protein [Chitinophaga fulva]